MTGRAVGQEGQEGQAGHCPFCSRETRVFVWSSPLLKTKCTPKVLHCLLSLGNQSQSPICPDLSLLTVPKVGTVQQAFPTYIKEAPRLQINLQKGPNLFTLNFNTEMII